MRVLANSAVFYTFKDFETAKEFGEFKFKIEQVVTQGGKGHTIYVPKVLVRNIQHEKDTKCDLYFLCPSTPLSLHETISKEKDRVRQEWPDSEDEDKFIDFLKQQVAEEAGVEASDFDLYYKYPKTKEVNYHLPSMRKWEFDQYSESVGYPVYRIRYAAVLTPEQRSSDKESFDRGLISISLQLGGSKYVANKDQTKKAKRPADSYDADKPKKSKVDTDSKKELNKDPNQIMTQDWTAEDIYASTTNV
jgi:hypothetical protein